MSIKVNSAALNGLNAISVDVEVDASLGLRFFSIVGLASKVVDESKHRIAAAIKNCGFVPYTAKNRRIIINLAPADIKKEGPLFDLPIALGYLLVTDQIEIKSNNQLFVGELSLDGSIKKVSGVLSISIHAKEKGFEEIIVPLENAEEASLVEGIKVIGVSNLNQVINHVNRQNIIEPRNNDRNFSSILKEGLERSDNDLKDIRGQENAKQALMVSAAGGHNILMYGPPGSGKTLLAKAIPTILPPLTYRQALDVTRLFSISGKLNNSSWVSSRPFRSPHHTASPASIIGGGTIPKPGEISLAHQGVLFFDEIAEFPRNVLEALRQPLEDGSVTVARTAGTINFPAQFIFVAAMNPCPCGNYGSDKDICTCSASSVTRYQKKISGPLLDRIDLHISVPQQKFEKIASPDETAPSSMDIRSKIIQARMIQKNRFDKDTLNSSMRINAIEKYCSLDLESLEFIRDVVDKKGISARGYHKILKVARTIADLEKSQKIAKNHLAQAISYRFLDQLNRLS